MTEAINSLGIPKPPRQTRVVAAMSGGVDSSVVAALLARDGYDVVGVTLQLYDHGAAVKKKGACCAGQDIHDAKRVAESLSIPHYVLDYEERFRRAVIDEFADSYARGQTPIPCIRCNEKIKFGDLLTLARELGADALATGHYVRRIMGANGPELHRAVDGARDQSYFLFSTTAAQLDMLRFPLGAMDKREVRAIGQSLGLAVADKPDSQDICFVPLGRYSDVVERVRPDTAAPGDIVDSNGAVVGHHPGIVHFTVGQRKGLGLSGNGEPLFVVALDAGTRRVTVGPRDALRVRTITLSGLNLLAADFGRVGAGDCLVKLRSGQAPIPARVRFMGADAAQVELIGGAAMGGAVAAPMGGAVAAPLGGAVAPGQACVFYEENGTRVLGGGWIAKTGAARPSTLDTALAPPLHPPAF